MRAFLAIPLIAFAACATATDAPSDKAQKRLAEALDGRVAGKTVDCVATSRVNGPDIIDNKTILYRESGRRIWRNDLPSACPFLRPNQILVLELYGSNMCKNDMFSVIERGGVAIPIGKCRLGQFTPYEKPRS